MSDHSQHLRRVQISCSKNIVENCRYLLLKLFSNLFFLKMQPPLTHASAQSHAIVPRAQTFVVCSSKMSQQVCVALSTLIVPLLATIAATNGQPCENQRVTRVDFIRDGKLLAYNNTNSRGYKTHSFYLAFNHQTRSIVAAGPRPHEHPGENNYTVIRRSDSVGDVLCIVDNLWTIYSGHSLSPPTAVNKDLEWLPAQEMIGCPPNLCADATVDAVTRGPGGIHWIKGNFLYISSAPRTPIKSVTMHYLRTSVQLPVDAAFAVPGTQPVGIVSGEKLLVTDYQLNETWSPVGSAFPGLHDRVNGAWSLPASGSNFSVSIVAGFKLYGYSCHSPPKIKCKLTSNGDFAKSYPKVFKEIDDAFHFDNQLFFLRHSFVIKVSSDAVTAPHTVQNTLITCSDQEFRDIFGKTLGVTDSTLFDIYKQKFKPPTFDGDKPGELPPPSPAFGSSTSSGARSTTVLPRRTQHMIIGIAVAATLLLLALVVGLVLWWRRRKSRGHHRVPKEATTVHTVKSDTLLRSSLPRPSRA